MDLDMSDKKEDDENKIQSEKQECENRVTNRRDIDGGWAWVVLFAGWMSLLLIGGCLTAVGIIHVFLYDAFAENDALTAGVGAVFTGLSFLLGPLSSAVSNRWSSRTCMLIGSILGPGMLAIGSQVSGIWTAFLTIGIMAGMGFGLITTQIYTQIGFYFERRRSLASGIVVLGVPVGMVASPACLTYLEPHYGWRGALLIYSGILLNLCVMSVLVRPSVLEKNREQSINIRRNSDDGVLPNCLGSELLLRRQSTNFRKFLKNMAMVFLILAVSFSSLGISTVYLHMPKFCLLRGATLADVQMILLAMGLGNILSKGLTGLGSSNVPSGERIDRSCLLLGSYSIAGTALCVLPSVSTSQVGRIICLSLVSIYYNTETSLYVPLTLDLVNLSQLNTCIGLEMFGIGTGFIVGPPLAALVRQLTGDYSCSIYFAGLSFLLAAVNCLMMMKTKPKHQQHVDTLSMEMKEAEILKDDTVAWNT